MAGYRELGSVLPLRVRPYIDPDNEAFWTAGSDGRLHVNRCGDCGWWIHPAAPRCRRCRSANVAAEPVSGRGRVATFTVNHKAWIPGSEPYIVALVELLEQPGLFLMTNLVDVDGEDVTLGMDVEVVFEEVDEIYLPLFRPLLQPVDGGGGCGRSRTSPTPSRPSR
jgi:uncharacterized protein